MCPAHLSLHIHIHGEPSPEAIKLVHSLMPGGAVDNGVVAASPIKSRFPTNDRFNPQDPVQVEEFIVSKLAKPTPDQALIFNVWLRSNVETAVPDLVKEFEKTGRTAVKAESDLRLVMRLMGKALKYPGFTRGRGVAPQFLRLLVNIRTDARGHRHHVLTAAGRKALQKVMSVSTPVW